MNSEDTEIRAAINAVAAYCAGQYKRNLIRQISEDIQEEVAKARLDGKPIDTTRLFVTLAEKYAN